MSCKELLISNVYFHSIEKVETHNFSFLFKQSKSIGMAAGVFIRRYFLKSSLSVKLRLCMIE